MKNILLLKNMNTATTTTPWSIKNVPLYFSIASWNTGRF